MEAKGSMELAELCPNSDANHSCTKFCKKKILTYISYLDANKLISLSF